MCPSEAMCCFDNENYKMIPLKSSKVQMQSPVHTQHTPAQDYSSHDTFKSHNPRANALNYTICAPHDTILIPNYTIQQAEFYTSAMWWTMPAAYRPPIQGAAFLRAKLRYKRVAPGSHIQAYATQIRQKCQINIVK